MLLVYDVQLCRPNGW